MIAGVIGDSDAWWVLENERTMKQAAPAFLHVLVAILTASLL